MSLKEFILKASLMLGYMLLERWLGRTKSVEANSVLDLMKGFIFKGRIK